MKALLCFHRTDTVLIYPSFSLPLTHPAVVASLPVSSSIQTAVMRPLFLFFLGQPAFFISKGQPAFRHFDIRSLQALAEENPRVAAISVEVFPACQS